MIRFRHRVLPIALAALVAGAPALAWTAPTRARIAEEAIRLMPASLRLALERHREDVLRGMLEPMTREDEPDHRPPWDGGTLDAEIAARAEALVRAAESAAPFSRVARAFGGLSHYVADAGFPPGAAGRGGATRWTEFAAFCESRLDKFPLVFYGHEDEDLARGDFRAFALREARRAREEYEHVGRAYASAGPARDPAAFDDRSIPFAVGSLAYSRTVTLVVRAWLAAWKGANGDVGRTPYLEKPAPRAAPERNP